MATNVHRSPLTTRRVISVLSLLSIVLLAAAMLGLAIGSVSIPIGDVARALIGDDRVAVTARTIILEIRLPRVLLAIMVGAGLSVAG
ncbi:MAG: iron ABC transporter permease, partial [Ignavibacteria bacterium]|nr:iron ABC transporter permease [Ignavibacteria bacterium]